MSSFPRSLVVAWLGVAALVIGACGGDDESSDPGSPAPSPRSSQSPASQSPTSQSPTVSGSAGATSGSAAPPVAPATGVELREQTASLRLPEGWREAPAISSIQSGGTGPGGAGTIDLIDDDTLNPGTPLEQRVRSAIKTLPAGANYTRLPDVMLGDTLAYHLTYTEPGRTEVNDLVETERNQRLVTIDFILSAKALRQEPDLVASVLASFRWTD